MGRAKVKMELITKEKSRSLAFKKRKEGLFRKLHELTTLCDVGACMIVYENGAVEPELWPKNRNEVSRIIGVYKAKKKDCAGNKTFGLSDFFHMRAKKAEEELSKMKKKNLEAKYPTRTEWLTELGEAQLRDFSALLANKANYVKSIIQILRANQITTTTFENPNFHHQMLMQHQCLPNPNINHHSNHSMFLMNLNHQFHPPSYPTYSIQQPSASLISNIAGGSGSLDPMISHMSLAPPEYHAPPPPPPQCNMLQGQVNWEIEEDGQDEIDQFFINNYSAWC